MAKYPENMNLKKNSTRYNDEMIVTTFGSIGELEQYINNTPLNETCRWKSDLASISDSESFTGTKDYPEAIELMKYGYTEGAEKLVKALKVKKQETGYERKIMLDVVGFQPNVPAFLNGLPQTMNNVRMTPKPNKIITLNKCIDYNGGVSVNQIIEWSTRTLRIIKTLEGHGYSVNLNVVDGSIVNGYHEIIKVRIKNANERLNISKLSFALLHPSMLRRIMFRYQEITETLQYKKPNSHTNVYGGCIPDEVYKEVLGKQKEIFLNRSISEEELNNIDILKIKN